MRLTHEQIVSILNMVQHFAGEKAHVYLFGSRLDDQAKGGDVDLLIETSYPLKLLDRAYLKIKLEERLGLPVDIIIRAGNETPTPFQRLAQAQATKLDTAV